MSDAIEFVSLAWHGLSSRSWLCYNQRVRAAAHIAAEGMWWGKGTIGEMLELRNYRYGITKCLGENGMEHLYATAVRAGNRSFCLEYERWAKRPPLIVENVNGRQRDRLCLGSEFQWAGETVEVTSFNAQGEVVCCSYETAYEECKSCGLVTLRTKKLLHWYILNPKTIRAARKGVENESHATHAGVVEV